MVMTTSTQIGKGVKAISEHRFALAADLGQAHDYTAIAVTEHVKTFHVRYDGKETFASDRYLVRHLERLPLGLSYPEQVNRIGCLLARPPLGNACTFLIDETAIGRPVGDIFNSVGLKPIRVTITAGEGQSQKASHRWSVSKHLLVSGLDARLHTGEMKIAQDLAEAGTLREELKSFRRHVSAAGRFSFEARSGQFDDAVLATAISLWAHVGRTKLEPARCLQYYRL